MQEQNVISIDLFKNKARLADFLNGYVYDGREVVQPGGIQEMDPVMSRSWKEGNALFTNVNIVDLTRKVETDYQVVLVALQNQTDIHYAMPVRVMNADAINYYNQWRDIQKRHRKEKDLHSAGEYLSGFGKMDRLLPVVSIVIYFGREPWDGPRALKDILDLSDCPEVLQKMIADYPINLFEVRRYTGLEKFRTDLQIVFGFLQNEEEKTQLEKYVKDHEAEFSDMEEDAYDLLSVMSRTRELKELKEKQKQKGGGYNMCKAIDDMVRDGERRGEQKGIQKGELKGLNENRINLLNQKLLKDDRLEDLMRAVADHELQCRLLEEYAL